MNHTQGYNSKVSREGTPDNPETPEQMQNFMHPSLQHVIPFYGAKIPFVITHMRAGHGMTRREGPSARIPTRVWYTPGYTPINEPILQSYSLYGGTHIFSPLYWPKAADTMSRV